MRPRPPQRNDPGAERRSRPGELRRLVLSARHAMTDLFAAHGIPADARAAILRRSVDDLIRHCHRTERPRRLFLELVDDHCTRHVAASSAEETGADDDHQETDDDERPPDS